MAVNDFEKQVQKKMEEFRLRPAEPVWEKIEKEISKKERKKRPLFIILLCMGVLVLGYTGYKYFMPHDKITKNLNTSSRSVQPKIEDTNASIQKESVNLKEKKSRNSNPESSISYKKKNIAGQAQQIQQSNTNDEKERLVNADHIISRIQVAADEFHIGTRSNILGNPESLHDKTELAIQPKPVNPKKVRSSRLGLKISAGFSDVSGKILPVFGGSSSLDIGSPATGSPGPGYPGSGYVLIPSSPTKMGSAIKAGIFWEKDLTRRTGLSIGIQYAQLRNHIEVGNRTTGTLQLPYADLANQVSTSFYSGAHQKRFTNEYHFIEMPVDYHIQLNKSQHIPVTWTLGLSLGKLISSNALAYDTAMGGIYYHQRELFNKTHVNLNSGFLLHIKGRNDMSWSIGPQAAMDMSSILKDGYDKKRFLFVGSLEARLSFGRKLVR